MIGVFCTIQVTKVSASVKDAQNNNNNFKKKLNDARPPLAKEEEKKRWPKKMGKT